MSNFFKYGRIKDLPMEEGDDLVFFIVSSYGWDCGTYRVVASGGLAEKLRELGLRENQEVYVRGVVVDGGPGRNCSAYFGIRVAAEEVELRK